MNEDKNAISSMLKGLIVSINKECVETSRSLSDNEMVVSARSSAEKGDHEQFYFDIIYPFFQLLDGILTEVTDEPKASFFIKHGERLQVHFTKLIERYEGSGCSVDKSRTIVRRLIKFYLSGEHIEFDYTAKYTYHLPTKIFTTHDEIIEFAEGLQSFHYGNPIKYIMAYQKVMEKGKK